MTDTQKYSRVDTFDLTEHLQPLNEESEQNYLPCYRFSNRLSFSIWRYTRLIWLDCLVIIAVFLPIVGFMINIGAGVGLSELDFFFIVFASIISYPPLAHYNSFEYIEKTIPVACEIMLYAEVIKYKPSSDPRTWTIIGNHLSKKFIEENQCYPLFNELDYFNLFHHLTRMKKGSADRNNNNRVRVHTDPLNKASKVNETPGNSSNLDESGDVTVETTSNETENEVSNNKTANIAPKSGVSNKGNDNISTINPQNIKSNSTDGLLKYLHKARNQAILSFEESEERYWSTLYPDFAE